MQAYADDHGGWLPNVDDDPFKSIQALYPNYIIFPPHLAGLSGDEKAVGKLLKEGRKIDQSVSGWVYFPGFRSDDDPRIAILWDKTEGLGMGGGRIGRTERIVGFVNLAYKVIDGKNWQTFTREQEELRKSTLADRETQRSNPNGKPGPH